MDIGTKAWGPNDRICIRPMGYPNRQRLRSPGVVNECVESLGSRLAYEREAIARGAGERQRLRPWYRRNPAVVTEGDDSCDVALGCP